MSTTSALGLLSSGGQLATYHVAACRKGASGRGGRTFGGGRLRVPQQRPYHRRTPQAGTSKIRQAVLQVGAAARCMIPAFSRMLPEAVQVEDMAGWSPMTSSSARLRAAGRAAAPNTTSFAPVLLFGQVDHPVLQVDDIPGKRQDLHSGACLRVVAGAPPARLLGRFVFWACKQSSES